jgi:ATP-dependent helicase/nuclease subunit B
MRERARLFSIPPGAPFLETLLDAVISGRLVPGLGEDPLELARTTILLPTRRACRTLSGLFATRLGRPTLLPRIRPIGEVEEVDDALREAAEEGLDRPELPPAIPPLERRLVLTRLVLAWAERLRALGRPVPVPASPADAAWLAGELARLMDTIATESLTIDALARIQPGELQEHWEISLEFLEIAKTHWPAYLSAAGWIEPAERRRLLVEAEAERLSRLPPAPVIAAGSTGSIPATAKLLSAIARLARGAVVLPGLDRDLDDATFRALAGGPEAIGDPVPSHPQASMARLLRGLGVADRAAEVEVLGDAGPLRARERLVSAVMRPADTTEAWSRSPLPAPEIAAALDGLTLVEAMHEQEEAVAIAALLRETIETPGATAALITPDRTLARRVAAELGRYGLSADDTSGVPLAETSPALLARLLVEAARERLAPVPLLALLKHPLARFGLDKASLDTAVGALERLVFRGVRPAPGLAGLAAALESAEAAIIAKTDRSTARRGLTGADRDAANALLRRLNDSLAPVLAPFDGGAPVPLSTLAAAHAEAFAAVVAGPDASEEAVGEAELANLFEEAASAPEGGFACSPGDYPDLLLALMAGRTVRPPVALDPRLKVYGLLEARLARHDRLVLGGLAEGAWPSTTNTDPWLSRTMRAEVGLPAPERRVGLSAHDFAQALGTRDVCVTRALRAGAAPTVPSRWLQRLAAVVGEDPSKPAHESPLWAARARGRALLDALRARDAISGPPRPVARPMPAPPVQVRPRRLSVTAIEKLVGNPYIIYATEVLKLRAFEPIGGEPSAAERGTLIHDVFARAAALPGEAPTLDRILELGRETFAVFEPFPEVHVTWWERFRPAAAWFAGFEKRRREEGRAVAVEIEGRMTVSSLPGGPFVLTARADRIEQTLDGRFVIVDYKTGQLPSAKKVAAGYAPQLPLEAVILRAGGFAGFAPELTPAALEFVKVTGKRDGAETMEIAPPKGMTLDDLIEGTWRSTRYMLARFDDPATPYASRADSRMAPRYDDHAHLARQREWGLVGDDGEGET